jgi:hypothetical protein
MRMRDVGMKIISVLGALALGMSALSSVAGADDVKLPWKEGVTALNSKEALAEPSENKALVLFWGSWCSVCKNALKKDIPELQKTVGGFAVLPVTLDKDEGRATQALKDNGITYASFIDRDKKIAKDWKVFAAPHWTVLKKEGGVWKKTGSMSGWNVNEVRNSLLAK